MLAVECTTSGGPEVLRQCMVPIPEIGPEEILIQVMAAGVNGPDVAQRKGIYPPPNGASPLLGLEVAGRVVGAGARTQRFKTGDHVVALVNGGGYAEYVVAPQGQVLPMPAAWTWPQAATIPETFFTMQQALLDPCPSLKDRFVLVHGGSGGLGGTAIQLAKMAGAQVAATVSSDEKGRYAIDMGADLIIDRTRDEIREKVKQFTVGRGMDVIIDVVGAAALAGNISVAAHGARLILLAVQGGSKGEINMGTVLMKNLTLAASTLRPQSNDFKARLAVSLQTNVWPAIARDEIIAPRITRFRLEDAAEAHRFMQNSDRIGRVVLIPPAGQAELE